MLDGWLDLTTSALTDFSQYASSPGCRAHCYTGLTVSSPAVAETITGTHCTYTRRDGQAEWAWMNVGVVGIDPPEAVTNPSTNQAQRGLTLLS